MIANLIGGFITVLIGVSLVGPLATQVNAVASGPVYNASNASQLLTAASDLYSASTWGAAVVNMLPGFFSLAILGVGIAITYSALRESGIV